MSNLNDCDCLVNCLVNCYHKFSYKDASPNKGAPSVFWGVPWLKISRFLAISQPKMVPFSFYKKPLEAENVPCIVMSLLLRPAPLLENIWYFESRFYVTFWGELTNVLNTCIYSEKSHSVIVKIFHSVLT